MAECCTAPTRHFLSVEFRIRFRKNVRIGFCAKTNLLDNSGMNQFSNSTPQVFHHMIG